jgi:HK97 family phage portal protein
MNRLLARIAGVEDRAAQITHPTTVPPDALALRYGNPGQPLYPRQNPDTAVEWGYWANLYAYKCVNTIASTIAGLPFRAAEQVGDNPDLTSNLAQLLGPAPGGPNAYWSSALLWRYLVAQWLVQGRFALLKQYSGGQLAGLFPLQIQGMFPVPAETGPAPFARFEYLRGTPYYRGFTPGELVYCWNPSQIDWRQPESVLGPAARTVNLMKLLEDFDTSFLVNGGVPAYLVTTEAFADKDDRGRFRRQFERFYGSANAGQVMFAERAYQAGEGSTGAGAPPDPVRIDTIGINQRDAELSSLRDNKIRDLCVAFGVPLSLLGDSSLTRFHQTAEDRQFYYAETISPLVGALADQVNISLGAELDEFGWFETSSIRELARARVFTNDAVAAQLVSSNLITRDEWRSDAGLPPADKVGLTEPVIAPQTIRVTDRENTLVPVSAPQHDTSPGAAAPQPSKPALAPASGARDDVVVVDFRALAAARRDTPAEEERHQGPDGHLAGVNSGHLTLNTLAQAYTVRLRRFLAQQADAVGRRLSGRRSRAVRAAMAGNVETLFDVGYWQSEGARLFPEHEQLVREAVQATAADLEAAIAAGADDDTLLAVVQRAATHYRFVA